MIFGLAPKLSVKPAGGNAVAWESRDPGAGRVTLFSQPGDIRTGAWAERVIATKKCPHSLDVADINGDGRLEIVIAEHDAFTPDGEAVNAGLFIYHPPPESEAEWTEETIDNRFEHFNGANAIALGGTLGIVSHGWMEPRNLHLWQPISGPASS